MFIFMVATPPKINRIDPENDALVQVIFLLQGCIRRFYMLPSLELTYPLTMIFLTSQGGGGVKLERPKKP